MTYEEYRELWEKDGPNAGRSFPERLMPGTIVLNMSRRSSPMGDGLPFFDDFGHAVEFCRSDLPEPVKPGDAEATNSESTGLPGLDMMLASWQRYLDRFSPEDLMRRWTEGNAAFDQLLREFISNGYRPEMGERLMEATNQYCLDLELEGVYRLPDDLGELFHITGDPLANREDDEDIRDDDEAIKAAVRAFDMHNPEHNEKLIERMWDIFS